MEHIHMRHSSENAGLLRHVLTRNYFLASDTDNGLDSCELEDEVKDLPAIGSFQIVGGVPFTPVAAACGVESNSCFDSSSMTQSQTEDAVIHVTEPTPPSASEVCQQQQRLQHNDGGQLDSLDAMSRLNESPSGWAALSPLSPRRSKKSAVSPQSPLIVRHLFSPGRQKKSNTAINDINNLNSGTFSPSPSPKNKPHFVFRRKDIQFGKLIGKGAFGTVYEGNMLGQPVAIKIVRKRRGSGIHREILQAERLACSLTLRHENIISILYVSLCDEFRGDAQIIMELVSSRTLQTLLDDVNRVITRKDRITFALEIASALQYLHDNHVAHLDVKPRNVLMTSEEQCKLGDFGSLTRTRSDTPREESEFTQLLGTLPYRAPELMTGSYPSSKADVYSLGITLWQLVTREAPHEGISPHQLIYWVIKDGKRPEPHHAGNDILEVAYRDLYQACWDGRPHNRPKAEDVYGSLSLMLYLL